ncbi:glycogenin-1-like isoform X1 [Scyliorhinus canicula]|uniref:glycogenin-1-like isoform X1 n=1 Tax=Scyliorhinus canicula TaxID=7830 RepID=UPI0018F2F68D|nr:glycogenin-1-like isoform X1 [Scyliorhinus canicula]
MSDQAFVTLATNDLYGKGALVLGTSLRKHKTTRQLVVLVSPQVSNNMRAVLGRIFDEIILVNVLDSKDSARLAMIKRPELGVTFTKLHCWALTHYSKCIFMDADTLVLCNIDELFEREELSAAPDPGWPDCFNSGVFVYRPSIETYNELLQFSTAKGSFDGGDQGLLNSFFSNWATADINKHLPFIYNLSSVAIYSYLPAFKQYGADAKVVHFLGNVKPWNYTYDPTTRCVMRDGHDCSSAVHPEFLNMWWDTFTTSVSPLLIEHGISKEASPGKQELSCLVYALAFTCGLSFCRKEEKLSEAVSQLSFTPPPPVMSSEERRKKWEQGQADYMGVDSFENIQKKLDAYLN